MSGEPPRCPVCAHAVESVRDEAGWWAIPCGHALGRWNFEDIRARLDAARPLWRVDVPEAPEHVTALGGIQDTLWLRQDPPPGFDAWGGSWWACRFPGGALGPVVHITDIVSHAPLVETDDPRSTS